jgi:hypothetical protein
MKMNWNVVFMKMTFNENKYNGKDSTTDYVYKWGTIPLHAKCAHVSGKCDQFGGTYI